MNDSNLFFLTALDRPTVVRAEGVHVYTDDGRRFIDGSSGPVAVNIGYSNPRVLEALRAQMTSATFAYRLHFVNDATETLASQLVDLMPGDLDRAFFVSGGSEAVESCIKLARQYAVAMGQHSRTRVISLHPSYHGGTLGSLALTGHDLRTGLFEPLLAQQPKIDAPRVSLDTRDISDDDKGRDYASSLDREIRRLGPENVLAFIFEPVGGAATGANVAPDTWLPEVRRICDEHGVLLVADEVMSGLGRAGSNLACDHWSVVPDIVAVSKGLGAGYVPLGAAVASQRLLDPVIKMGGFVHGHTYAGNPLACAAGSAVLAELVDRDLCGASMRQGAVLRDALVTFQSQHSFIGDVRGRGLLLGVELVADAVTMEPLPPELNANTVLAELCYDHELILYPGRCRGGLAGDHLLVAPPLTISDDELADLIERFGAALDDFSTWLAGALA